MTQAVAERESVKKPRNKNKKKKWIRFRHKVITFLLRPAFSLYSRWKYGITVEKFAAEGDRQYLAVFNHQTAFDQFFVSIAFRKPVYYIASEDIFSMGILSRLLQYAVAPIPIKKQTTDVSAVMNSMRVAREGGTIALAPEGNRTFSGRNCHMNPAITKLVRKLKLPLAIFRIEGGYGVQPRWCDAPRKGRMHAGVSRVIEPEEYLSLSEEELYALLEKELERLCTVSLGETDCTNERRGNVHSCDILPEYAEHILGYVDASKMRPMRIVVHAFNGMAGAVLDVLEGRLPFEFIRLGCEPDGSFPCGVPNPMLNENRELVSRAVREHHADMGIAWDGDFDRCFIFDEEGMVIEGHRHG